MNRNLAATIALALFLVMAPALRAAGLRTDSGFAFTETAPPGTHFWCAFPDIAGRWTVVMFERRPRKRPWPARGYIYVPFAAVTKPAGIAGPALEQMMVIPAHTGDVCLLAAYRDGIQQPYRGWTPFNPFGWHTFGFNPLAARIAEFPPRVPGADIARFERLTQSRWPAPVP